MKISLFVISICLLYGCSSIQEKSINVSSKQKINCSSLEIQKLILLKVKFNIVFDESGERYAGLDGKNYGNLSKNMQAIIKGIKQLKGGIQLYKTCIADFNQN